jgi:hypothetical protein
MLVVFVCAGAIGAALAEGGCLTVSEPTATLEVGDDSGTLGPPILDASGVVDGASPLPSDAGTDASVDAASFDAAAPGHSTVGLVGGGTLSQSAHYTLIGATGPATAPVLQSPKYQLTGGMTAAK